MPTNTNKYSNTLFNFKPINYFQISDEDRITPKLNSKNITTIDPFFKFILIHNPIFHLKLYKNHDP